jgi:thiamine-phosphate pyrophosphorylase
MTHQPSKRALDLAQALAQQHAGMLAGDGCSLAQAIALEQAEQLPENTTNGTTHPNSSDEMTAVRLATRMLGFVTDDVHCLAHAWQRHMARTGTADWMTWPTEPEDFGVRPTPRANAFATCPKALGLYAVLPDAQWVARMAQAGVPTLQLRFKSDDTQAVAREVAAAVKAVEGTASLLFINDHWQAAIDAGAYGVHLGQEDMDDAPLECIRAAGLRLGLSTHGYAEMLRADAVSPSYLALGAVFPTTLKRMKTAPQGLGRLYAYAQLMRHHSLVAIGGIDTTNIDLVTRSGVGSVAMVRAITAAADPVAAARELQARIALI